MTNSPSTQSEPQYSIIQILGIWAAAAIPMAILGWVIYPALAPEFETDPLEAGVTRVVLLTLGLIWLFVLSMIIVYREEGDLRWATVRRRLWLNTPLDPETDQPRRRLWLWVLPFLIGVAIVDVALASVLDDAWISIFSFFAEPTGYGLGAFLESAEVQAQLVDAWWFLGLFAVFALFNSVLGEEFLWRGVLLPKMNGVFGKWDWVANGVLFGFYHVSMPWSILTNVISGMLLAYPARRFRSTWMSVIVHSAQSVFFLFLILGLVLGLA
jgi:membrane protease YdiL (CAAX protease family)